MMARRSEVVWTFALAGGSFGRKEYLIPSSLDGLAKDLFR
jgi:hypothetical protein